MFRVLYKRNKLLSSLVGFFSNIIGCGIIISRRVQRPCDTQNKKRATVKAAHTINPCKGVSRNAPTLLFHQHQFLHTAVLPGPRTRQEFHAGEVYP